MADVPSRSQSATVGKKIFVKEAEKSKPVVRSQRSRRHLPIPPRPGRPPAPLRPITNGLRPRKPIRPQSCLLSEGKPPTQRRHSIASSLNTRTAVSEPTPFDSPIDISATSRLFGKALRGGSTPLLTRRVTAAALSLRERSQDDLGASPVKTLFVRPATEAEDTKVDDDGPKDGAENVFAALQAQFGGAAEKKAAPKPKPKPKPNTKACEAQRLNIGQEVLKTEQTYVDCLFTLRDVFKQPLLDMRILNIKDSNALFSVQLDTLITRHSQLLKRLKSRLGAWRSQSLLGDLFVELAGSDDSLLSVYTAYVNDFPGCMHALRKLGKSNTGFRHFIDAAAQNPRCSNLDLTAFLLTPVQRLPRYLLLLKSLLKCTPEDHPDRENVESAVENIKGMVTKLNASFEKSSALATELLNKRKKRKRRGRSSQGFFSTGSKGSSLLELKTKEEPAAQPRQRSASVSAVMHIQPRHRLRSMFSKQSSEPVLSPRSPIHSKKRKSDEAFQGLATGDVILEDTESSRTGSSENLHNYPNKARRLFGGIRSRLGSLGKRMVPRPGSSES